MGSRLPLLYSLEVSRHSRMAIASSGRVVYLCRISRRRSSPYSFTQSLEAGSIEVERGVAVLILEPVLVPPLCYGRLPSKLNDELHWQSRSHLLPGADVVACIDTDVLEADSGTW